MSEETSGDGRYERRDGCRDAAIELNEIGIELTTLNKL
jgi:hypothetical protein